MADCSKLSKLITQLATNIATDPNVKNLTDVVDIMKDALPQYPITYEFVSEAIHEATTQRNRRVSELAEKLNAIRNEARGNVNLQKSIDELQGHLEQGTLPDAKSRSVKAEDIIQNLRDTVQELRSEVNRSAPARKKRLEKAVADLEAKLKSGDILPRIKREPATDEEIETLVFKRDLLRKEINDEIRAAKPLTAWGKVGVGADMIRLIMTSGEFSYALRQGGVYAFTHPLKWTAAMAESFKAFGSTRALYNLNKQIFSRKNAPKYETSGLVILHEGMSLTSLI